MVYGYGFDILRGQIDLEFLYKKAQRRTLVFERTAPGGYESISLSPDLADADILSLRMQSGNLLSSHNVYDEQWAATKKVEVPFAEYSSDGTKRTLDLSDAFAKAMNELATIVIDELDLHLHPSLVRHLIALVNSIEHNRGNAQLVCTTHDVLLLDEDIHRDQI
ncbi:MAG: ATP-binding protein [Clostridiales bacterium]|nr:ATP-binding protein [Clostridiales bacterium]